MRQRGNGLRTCILSVTSRFRYWQNKICLHNVCLSGDHHCKITEVIVEKTSRPSNDCAFSRCQWRWISLLATLLIISTTDGLGAEPQHYQGGGQHHDFPQPVTEFHDVLAPLWHTPSGHARTQRACDQLPALQDKAAVVKSMQAHDRPDLTPHWAQQAAQLQSKITALAEICATGERAGFDHAFADVHAAFHDLVRLLGHTH